MDRRGGLSSRRLKDQEEKCPLSVECVHKLIARLEAVEHKTSTLPEITSKISEIHDKFVHAKGFVAGARMGGMAVIIGLGVFFIFLYGVFSGKIGIKELFGVLF